MTAGFSDQLSVSGCDIIVTTPAAQQFALTVHELATYAVKYGALSAPDGRIATACDVEKADGDGGTFSFVWKETGGPKVSPPKRKGFGSVILLEAAKQFGTQIVLDYEPDGLRVSGLLPSQRNRSRRHVKHALLFGSLAVLCSDRFIGLIARRIKRCPMIPTFAGQPCVALMGSILTAAISLYAFRFRGRASLELISAHEGSLFGSLPPVRFVDGGHEPGCQAPSRQPVAAKTAWDLALTSLGHPGRRGAPGVGL